MTPWWEILWELIRTHKIESAVLGLMWLASYLYGARKLKEAHRASPPLKWKTFAFPMAVNSFFTFLIMYLFLSYLVAFPT
jgi:hypothetical protein